MIKIKIIEISNHHGCKARLSQYFWLYQQLISSMLSLFTRLRESKNIPVKRVPISVCCTGSFSAPHLQGILCLVPPHPIFKERFQIMFWHFSSINSDTVSSAGKCQVSPSCWGGGVGSALLTPLPLPAFIVNNFHTRFPNQIWFCHHIQWVYNTGIVAGNVSALNVIPDAASHRISRNSQVNLFFLSKCQFRCKKP